MIRYKIIDVNLDVDVNLDSLPEWRREQALKYRFPRGRWECAMSYRLLADMLGYEPAFEYGEHGKPRIVATEKEQDASHTFFNMSHCANAIGVAISDHEVGIDVESLGRYKPALAEYCMNEEELREIDEADDKDAMFTLLWTRKEALLKMTGEGITDDMKTCLTSSRMKGVRFEGGVEKEKGYAWSVCTSEGVYE